MLAVLPVLVRQLKQAIEHLLEALPEICDFFIEVTAISINMLYEI
jgi:hypothetical protein